MANILAMKDVTALPGVRVTMDSTKERAVVVEFEERVLKFEECADGLYYLDTTDSKFKKSVSSILFYQQWKTIKNIILVKTLKEQKMLENCSKK